MRKIIVFEHFFTILLLLISFRYIWGQSIQYNPPIKQVYSAENSSLTSNIFYKFHTDYFGFVWIASENGIFKYNGNGFYKVDLNLDDDEIINVYANNNLLYLFNYTGQLSIIDIKTNSPLNTSSINQWLGQYRKYFIYNATYLNDTLFIADNVEKPISINSEFGTTTIVSRKMMWDKLIENYTVPKNFPNSKDVESFVWERSNNLKIAEDNIILYNTLYFINNDTIIKVFDGEDYNIKEAISGYIKIDNDLYLSFFNKFGVIKFTDYFNTIRKDPVEYTTVLKAENVYDITKDKSNNIYVSIPHIGITVIPNNPYSIIQYNTFNSNISSNNITLVKKDDNDGLILVNKDRDIDILRNNKINNLNLDKTNYEYTIKDVKINKEKIYVFSSNYIIHYKNNNLFNIEFGNNKDINEDSNFYYIAGRDKYHMLSKQNGNDSIINFLPIAYFSVLHLGSNIYAGTISGVYYNGRLIENTATDRINQIRRCKNTILASGRKAIYFINEDNVVKTLTKKDGLVGDNFTEIEYDGVGNIFALSDDGVNIIDSRTFEIVQTFEGKKLTQPLKINSFTVKDSTLFLATNNGLWKIPYEYFSQIHNAKNPDVYIRPLINNSVTSTPIDSENLKINYKSEQNIKLIVETPGYQFYQLEQTYSIHENSKFIDSNQLINNAIYINNPRPGKYNIKIFSKAAYHIAPTFVKEYAVTILPLWYQTTLFKWIIGCLLIMSLVFSIYYLYRRQVRKNDVKFRKKEKLVQLEHKSLFGQLKSHFIFNALNPLQGFILKKETDNALEYLEQFSKLVRGLLNQSRDKQTTVEQELEFVNNYIKVAKTREVRNFDYSLNIENNRIGKYIIPTMMLQPIVENAIEHGISNNQNNNGTLEIDLKEVKNELHIITKDSGNGFDISDSKHHNHALTIIIERLALLKSEYGVGDLRIIKEQKKNSVVLILPIRTTQ